MSAKDTIVDVKATDNQGKIYQIEIQTSAFRTLKHRMLYTWSHVYKDQLQQGDRYQNLHPVISIWLLSKNVISGEVSGDYHHHFEAHDIKHGVTLSDHFNIHIIELPKWEATRVATPKQQWLYFFKEGGRINADSPPEVLKTSTVMVQAMDTLRQFSDQEENYDLYQARQAYILEQNTIAYDLELALEEKKQALEEKELERKAKEEERKAKEKALASEEKALAGEEKAIRKKVRLEVLLKKYGIDPNEAE
jgi:predicted transposase/invertase (TIGR01784 family)